MSAGVVVVTGAPVGAADGVRGASAVQAQIAVADVELAGAGDAQGANAVGEAVVASRRGADDELRSEALVGDREVVGSHSIKDKAGGSGPAAYGSCGTHMNDRRCDNRRAAGLRVSGGLTHHRAT